jgi:hypothetical protein
MTNKKVLMTTNQAKKIFKFVKVAGRMLCVLLAKEATRA